jgi:hypothetical protein
LALIYLVVFGGFACLFPLATYCLVLASLNGRRRPTVVAGPADFAGILLATSGFLIVGGPLILAGLHEAWRRQALRGSFATIRAALTESSGPWFIAWAAYFVVVVVGAAWLVARRRSIVVIYNIDATDAQKLVPDVLARLGHSWTQRGSTYYIGFTPAGPTVGSGFGPEAVPILRAERAVLGVTVVPAMRHATVRWSFATGDVRRRIEAEVREAVAGLEAPHNPIAGWLLAFASGLFAMLLLLLGMFVAFLWSLRG